MSAHDRPAAHGPLDDGKLSLLIHGTESKLLVECGRPHQCRRECTMVQKRNKHQGISNPTPNMPPYHLPLRANFLFSSTSSFDTLNVT